MPCKPEKLLELLQCGKLLIPEDTDWMLTRGYTVLCEDGQATAVIYEGVTV